MARHVSHVLFHIPKASQKPNPGDAQLSVISLATTHPRHQSKNVRRCFQHSDHMMLQFARFASNAFFFQSCWSHQSYQQILDKRRHGNLYDVHSQNVCTNVLVYIRLLYQNFFRLIVPSTTKLVYSFFDNWSQYYQYCFSHLF